MVKGKNKKQMLQKKKYLVQPSKSIVHCTVWHSPVKEQGITNEHLRQRKLKNSIGNRSLKEATELQKAM